MEDVYVFLDNTFLFIQGYKHVQKVANLPQNKKPSFNYGNFRKFVSKFGTVKRMVLAGSQLPGNLITICQRSGFEVFTLPRYPNIASGKMQEKGVDQKLVWEIAKTIFTNKEATVNKKIILCSGDKDFMPLLPDIQTSGWSLEVWMWNNSYSPSFQTAVSTFGEMIALDDEWKQFIDIIDAT